MPNAEVIFSEVHEISMYVSKNYNCLKEMENLI